MKPILAVLGMFLLSGVNVIAQTERTVKQPIHLSQTNDLTERFERLSCAIFEIDTSDADEANKAHGTGFFIGPDGKFLTAAHVVLNSQFSKGPTGTISIIVIPRPIITIHLSDGNQLPVAVVPTPKAAALASTDRFEGNANKKTPCYLHVGNSNLLKIGSHLLSIGFPNASPSASLSAGFLSGRYQHLPIVVPSLGPQPVNPGYDVLRVQMPIISGASGSPVIADDDTVVGVISEIPLVWTADLQRALPLFGQNVGGLSLGDFNSTKALIDLVFVVREFESPGFGLAIPTSYLQEKH